MNAPAIPTHVPSELVYTWDHYNDPDLLREPHAAYDKLRERYRIFFSPLNEGFWAITQYDDAYEALRRTDLWSSKYLAIPALENFLMPINLDPPNHTKYRRLISHPFLAPRVKELGSSIRVIAQELIGDIVGRNECEFMDEVGRPLPAMIFSRILGTPPDQWRQFAEWNYAIFHVDDMKARAAATGAVTDYLRHLVAQRADHPSDDLLSLLLTTEVDGERLTEDELLSFAVLLFMAGVDTISGALSFIFAFLARSPDHRSQLIDEPELIRPAVEEMLRCRSHVQLSRTATGDFEFAGVQIKQGDRLLIPLVSANRDDAAFLDAARIDFLRTPNKHIAFGTGPHKCVGDHLTREVIVILLEEWHRRFPGYEIDDAAPLSHHGGGLVGLNTLPLLLHSDTHRLGGHRDARN